jgi:hypothetical protein
MWYIGCNELTDGGMAALAKACPQLVSLCMYLYLDDPFMPINHTLMADSVIAMGQCTGLTQSSVISIAKSCHALTKLSTKSCKRVIAFLFISFRHLYLIADID